MTTTVIGDIHGWADRLERLLPQCEGSLLFVGDLIDRGPDAARVVARVRSLVDAGDAQVVMGNHEFALVRGLGVPSLGYPGDAALFRAWWQFYGGAQVCASYGVDLGDAEALRRAMGDDLEWLARLPWVVEHRIAEETLLICHAGLASRPWASQMQSLRHPQDWFAPTADLPPALYERRNAMLPPDLPPDHVVVNGHQPISEPAVALQHCCIDTSGGKPRHRLSGVVFPARRIIDSGEGHP
jgi:hypothetical protein